MVAAVFLGRVDCKRRCRLLLRAKDAEWIGIHHLYIYELRLRAPLSIVALAPSSLTATRCPQLKQVVRRCPQLLLRLGVKTCCHYVNVLERITSKTVVQHVPVSDKLQWQRPFHFISSSSPSSSTTLKYIILLLPPTLFGVSCRNIFLSSPMPEEASRVGGFKSSFSVRHTNHDDPN